MDLSNALNEKVCRDKNHVSSCSRVIYDLVVSASQRSPGTHISLLLVIGSVSSLSEEFILDLDFTQCVATLRRVSPVTSRKECRMFALLTCYGQCRLDGRPGRVLRIVVLARRHSIQHFPIRRFTKVCILLARLVCNLIGQTKYADISQFHRWFWCPGVATQEFATWKM